MVPCFLGRVSNPHTSITSYFELQHSFFALWSQLTTIPPIRDGWQRSLNRQDFSSSLVVEPTHVKNISQIGSFRQAEVKIKNVWNHHRVHTLFPKKWSYGALLLKHLLNNSKWKTLTKHIRINLRNAALKKVSPGWKLVLGGGFNRLEIKY